MTVITNGKIILEHTILQGFNLYVQDGKIVKISEQNPEGDCEIIDANQNYVSPGFVDIHTHGAAGFDYCKCDEFGVAKAADSQLKHGTTTVLPTITASSRQDTLFALSNVKKCMDKKLSTANVFGIHMEGPYFSLDMVGAQNPEFITEPIEQDYKEYVEQYTGVIKRWSYAPERDVDGKFCRYITDNKIVASAGHTSAKYEHMLTAMKNGCKSVTHLFSCTSTITRNQGFRKLGVIETAFLHDEIDVEIIADGKHLPPELIKLIYKIKGSDKISLVTDSMMVTDTPEKTGNLNGIDFVIEDGVCKLLDRTAFAGSIATCDRLVKVCTKEAGIDLVDAVKMMATTPASVVNLQNRGKLKEGFIADIVIFDDDINVNRVFVEGKTVFAL